MTKKIMALLLSVICVFSTLVVGSFAADEEYKTYDPNFKDVITNEDRSKYPAEELAIANPEKRIDITFLTGKEYGSVYAEEPACKSTLEYNLYFWDKEQIIDVYHALEQDENATAEQWGALYRKMKTPKNNDWTEESAYVDFCYEYRRENKATCDVKLVPSKTVLDPGEEFTVTVYLTTNFYTGTMYSTFFYNNDVVDIMSCTENYIGTDMENQPQPDSLKNMHELGAEWGNNRHCYVEIPHYGDYTYGGYVSSLGDMRELEWPDSLKKVPGYKNKYEAYNIIFSIKDYAKSAPAMKFNNQVLITLKFKVKDDAKPGATASIFAPSDSVYTTSKLDIYDAGHNGAIIKPCWQFFRVDPNTETRLQCWTTYDAQYDQTLTCTPANITVAGGVQGADYTAFDAEYALFNSDNSVLYSTVSWANYAAAYTEASSLSRTLTSDDQDTVDAATKKLADARKALVLNKLVSANVIGNVTVGEDATIKVVANGSPKTLRLVSESGSSSISVDRADATITTEGGNESWSFKIPVAAEQTKYNVFAMYGDAFGNDSVVLDVVATTGLDLSIHSISVEDLYGSNQNGKIYCGRHDIVVRTSLDVHKIQFVDISGNTVTYDKRSNPVVEGDELVWTVSFNFSKLGNFVYSLRTRAENTTFAFTGDSISGRVMY